MTRTGKAAVVGGLAVLVAVAIVAVVLSLRPDPDPEPVRPDPLPASLTPEEVSLVVHPQPDGSLRVDGRLVFDVAEHRDQPLTWSLGDEQIGSQDVYSPYFVAKPTVREVRAVELDTGPDSSADDPAEARELTVDHSDPVVGRPRPGTGTYTFAPPSAAEGEGSGRWSPGRHAVAYSYVLDDVYLDVEGRRLLVLPVGVLSAFSSADRFVSVSVTGGGAIECLSRNRQFSAPSRDSAPDCSGLGDHRLSAEGREVRYRETARTSVTALGFAPPNSVVAEPQPVEEVGT